MLCSSKRIYNNIQHELFSQVPSCHTTNAIGKLLLFKDISFHLCHSLIYSSLSYLPRSKLLYLTLLLDTFFLVFFYASRFHLKLFCRIVLFFFSFLMISTHVRLTLVVEDAHMCPLYLSGGPDMMLLYIPNGIPTFFRSISLLACRSFRRTVALIRSHIAWSVSNEFLRALLMEQHLTIWRYSKHILKIFTTLRNFWQFFTKTLN